MRSTDDEPDDDDGGSRLKDGQGETNVMNGLEPGWKL
jgi:hypothetical protein